MSVSVSASSNALAYLQSLLAQGTAGTGAASSATDPLSALMQSLTGSSASTGQASSAPAGATTGVSPFGNDMMAALISLQGQSANGIVAQSPSQLFAKIDTDGDGKISKSEFENALGSVGVDSSTADSLFAKLDTNGDGSVSPSELLNSKPAHGHHHHMHGGGGAKGGGSDADGLLSATGADGASTQTTTNPDGSTTTTITYADGSTIASTSAVAGANGASASGGTSNPDNSNLLEQLVQMQSQLISAATSTLSKIA